MSQLIAVITIAVQMLGLAFHCRHAVRSLRDKYLVFALNTTLKYMKYLVEITVGRG